MSYRLYIKYEVICDDIAPETNPIIRHFNL